MDPAADIGVDQAKVADTSLGSSGDSEDEQTSRRAVIHYDHEIGDYRFTSLTGWNDYDNQRTLDTDFLSVDYLNTAFSSDYEQFSQEFRVASPNGERLEYLLGLLYLEGDIDYSGITDTRFPPPYTAGPFPLDSTSQLNYDQETQLWSLFGHGTLHFGDRWRATIGLRYTDEQKDAVWERIRLRSGGFLADIVSNILAIMVARRALARYVKTRIGARPVWEKTRHVFPVKRM